MMSASDILGLSLLIHSSYGKAQALIMHVDASIRTATSIGDDAARVFAAQFY